MEKVSSQVLELVLDRLKRYGPTMATLGAGLAGASHLMSMKAQHEKDKADEQGNKNVIYLDIPAKTAGMFDKPSTAQYALDSAVNVGTGLAAGAVGYGLVDMVLKKVRQKRSEEELDRAKSDYSRLLSQKIYGMEQGKVASASSFPMIEGMIAGVVDNLEEIPQDKMAMIKEALSDPTIGTTLTSLPGLGALIAGILAHKYYYNRQKDIEAAVNKQDSEKAKRTPAMIKLRTIPHEAPVEEPKVAGVLSGGALDSLSTVESLANISEALRQQQPEEVEVAATEKKPAYDPKSTQPIDHNTVVIDTDDGETQVDAVDPQAVALLEKYKEVIAKSLAMGANLNKEPV